MAGWYSGRPSKVQKPPKTQSTPVPNCVKCFGVVILQLVPKAIMATAIRIIGCFHQPAQSTETYQNVFRTLNIGSFTQIRQQKTLLDPRQEIRPEPGCHHLQQNPKRVTRKRCTFHLRKRKVCDCSCYHRYQAVSGCVNGLSHCGGRAKKYRHIH